MLDHEDICARDFSTYFKAVLAYLIHWIARQLAPNMNRAAQA
jgi:hypothetical protein